MKCFKCGAKSKIWLIILVVVVIILGGLIGGGVWGYYKVKSWLKEQTEQSKKTPTTEEQEEPEEEEPATTEQIHPSDVPGEDISGVPRYPNSIRVSSYKEADSQSASYTGPKGVSAETIIQYYADTLPGKGWTQKRLTAGKEVLFADAQGKLLQVWIYEANIEEGTSYVIEYPPLNPNQ